MSVLRAVYPALFDLEKPVPLALGISKRLNDERRAGRLEINTLPLRHALNGWVKRDAYIAALAAGGFRIGLDGQPTEQVSDLHKATAAAMLRKRQAKKRTAAPG